MKINFDSKRLKILSKGRKLMFSNILPDEAIENSSYIIKLQFKDENDSFIVPISLNWSLYDDLGNIVNNRENVDVLIPLETTYIKLEDQDLQYGWKIVIISGIYQSPLLDDPQIFTDSVKFYVRNLIGE